MLSRLNQRWRTYRHRFTRALAGDLSDPEARRAARRHLMLYDHGFLRRVWTNHYRVAPGVWRANQPDPERIALLARQGFRTILTLRGEARHSYLAFEEEACAAHGITLHRLHLNASNVDPAETYLNVLDLLEAAEKPVLIHCKSGADRTGLASALYLLDHGAEPAVAKRQLALRYAHRRKGKAGILGLLLDRYAAARAETGIPLRDWLATGYDREEILATFKAGRR